MEIDDRLAKIKMLWSKAGYKEAYKEAIKLAAVIQSNMSESECREASFELILENES